jgi:DNA invertase Pin-like site-specific DNA recombinase
MARSETPKRRCAIYTRKSSEEGLEQEFNSLHSQREACERELTGERIRDKIAASKRAGFEPSLWRQNFALLLRDRFAATLSE